MSCYSRNCDTLEQADGVFWGFQQTFCINKNETLELTPHSVQAGAEGHVHHGPEQR